MVIAQTTRHVQFFLPLTLYCTQAHKILAVEPNAGKVMSFESDALILDVNLKMLNLVYPDKSAE